MATATATTPKAAGWRIPCVHCGAVADDDGDGGLDVRLADLSVRCPNCDEEVTRADLERLVADAQRLLRWLDAAAAV
jgi:hypothetical protein